MYCTVQYNCTVHYVQYSYILYSTLCMYVRTCVRMYVCMYVCMYSVVCADILYIIFTISTIYQYTTFYISILIFMFLRNETWIYMIYFCIRIKGLGLCPVGM